MDKKLGKNLSGNPREMHRHLDELHDKLGDYEEQVVVCIERLEAFVEQFVYYGNELVSEAHDAWEKHPELDFPLPAAEGWANLVAEWEKFGE